MSPTVKDESVVFCGQCGEQQASAHPDCERAGMLEPPRYCAQCARRLKVQVTPMGWRAECSRHGEIADDGN